MFGVSVAIVFTFFTWSTPGHFFVYTPDNIQRLAVAYFYATGKSLRCNYVQYGGRIDEI